MEVLLRAFLTSLLDGGEWLCSQPSSFTQAKGPLCALDMRVFGSQRRSGDCREKEGLLPVSGIEHRFHGCPAHSLVIALSYPGFMQLMKCSYIYQPIYMRV
jgi:hypothetical protein